MSARTRSALPLLLAAVVAGPGCGTGGGERRADAGEAAAAPGGAVVAMVDGAPITADRVARLAAETGESPREVVERLIDFELLAAEAERRGLRGGGELRDTTRKAMVQRFLEEEFERPRTPGAMPEAWLRGAYERNRYRFVHPRYLKVAHVRVLPGEGKSPRDRAREQALAEKIRAAALETKSPEEFVALAERFDGVEGQKVAAEVLQNPVHERAALVKEFIDEALELERPGDVSQPVRTSFGVHVIYLMDTKEAIDRSFEEVREEVRGNEHPYWLQAEFAALVDRLRLESKVEGYEGDLRRAGEAR